MTQAQHGGAEQVVRLGVVGLGNIGNAHCQMLLQGAVSRVELAAVASTSTPSAKNSIEDANQDAGYGVPHFSDYQALLTSGLVDAVLVATPTYSHPEIGRRVLEAGLHLLMEKPVAMSVVQAQSMLDVQPADLKFAVMLNQRFHPHYRQIHRLVQSQAIGRLTRVAWTMTAWYRPDIYYQVSRWRGTWPGEGGGLLINQCIHNLDVLQWIAGLPSQVIASGGFGKYHSIEVEDELTAMLTYEDGVTGVLVASSGEAPGINQLDIVGDRGTIRFDGTQVHLMTTDESVNTHLRETSDMFGMPVFDSSNLKVDAQSSPNDQHAAVVQNFVDSILDDAPLLTDAREGLASIQLANSLLLSAWTEQPVALPMNADLYETLLQKRISAAALREPSDQQVQINMDDSYR